MIDNSVESTAITPEKHRHLPGEAGIWVMVIADMIVFSLFFAIFFVHRAANLDVFAQSQATMTRGFGLLNTVLLLTSSWFVASAVSQAQRHEMKFTRPLLYGGIVCGVAFIISKIFEYSEKISENITLNTNEFYTFYYMFTGIHLVHVVIGLGVLIFIAVLTEPRTLTTKEIAALESGALFWHLVDLLWVVLFAILYLVR